MIRIALVGCGAWGWRFIPAALETGEARVTHAVGVGACPEAGRTYLAGVEVVDGAKLLDAPVDAFVVAAPPEKRLQTCIPLLQSGRAVLIEKPFALSQEDATALALAAREGGGVVLVNHQHLFAPAYEEIRDRAQGRALYVDLRSGNFGPHRSYSALWDYGPHDAAMLLGLLGAPELWRAFRKGGRFWLHAREGRALASMVTWNDAAKSRRLGVLYGDSSATYDELTRSPLVVDGAPVRVNPERPLQRALRAFVRAAKTGEVDWRFGCELPLAVTMLLANAERMMEG